MYIPHTVCVLTPYWASSIGLLYVFQCWFIWQSIAQCGIINEYSTFMCAHISRFNCRLFWFPLLLFLSPFYDVCVFFLLSLMVITWTSKYFRLALDQRNDNDTDNDNEDGQGQGARRQQQRQQRRQQRRQRQRCLCIILFLCICMHGHIRYSSIGMPYKHYTTRSLTQTHTHTHTRNTVTHTQTSVAFLCIRLVREPYDVVASALDWDSVIK